MGSLYKDDLLKFQKYFNESAELLGITVDYRYIIKRKTEKATGENIYSKLSKPIQQNVIIESGPPMIDSLKQLGWFVDTNVDSILVDFSIDTPNLQEGCRFTLTSNINEEQNKEYVINKLSNTELYPSCIKCLCTPVLKNESIEDDRNNIHYGQQEIYSDDENYTFISEKPKITFF